MNNIYPDNIDVSAEVEEFVRNNSKGSVRRTGDEFIFVICPFCKGEGNLFTLSKDPEIDYSLPEPEPKEARKHTHSFKVSEDQDERAAEWVEQNRGIPKEVTYRYKLAFGTDKFKNNFLNFFIPKDIRISVNYSS